MSDDSDFEGYAFLDPFLLLRALVNNSDEYRVKVALMAIVDVLLSAEQEDEIGGADLLEIVAHHLAFGHVCGPDCADRPENDFGDLTIEEVVEKFSRQLNNNKEDGKNE